MSTAAMGVGGVLGELLGSARGKTGPGPLNLAATGFPIEQIASRNRSGSCGR